MVPPQLFKFPQRAHIRVRLMRGYSRTEIYFLCASGLGLGAGVAYGCCFICLRATFATQSHEVLPPRQVRPGLHPS